MSVAVTVCIKSYPQNFNNNVSIIKSKNYLDFIRSQGTSDSSSSSGGNLTCLRSCGKVSAHTSRLAHVLLVSSSVRVVHGVHRHTPRLGPLVSLDAVFVEGSPRLHYRLVRTSSSRNNANHRTASSRDGLLRSGGKANTSRVLVLVLCNNNRVVPRGAGHLSTVAHLGLNIADNSSFWDNTNGQNVSDGKLSCGT